MKNKFIRVICLLLFAFGSMTSSGLDSVELNGGDLIVHTGKNGTLQLSFSHLDKYIGPDGNLIVSATISIKTGNRVVYSENTINSQVLLPISLKGEHTVIVEIGDMQHLEVFKF